MNLEFKHATKENAITISKWKYKGVYSFYDNDKTEAKYEWAQNIDKEDTTFVIFKDNELIGNCCFDYEEDNYMLGVQMRPDLTGKGFGTEFVRNILIFGLQKYRFKKIDLLVAKFNQRAIKIYKKLGFKIADEFTWHVNDEDKEFYTMTKTF